MRKRRNPRRLVTTLTPMVPKPPAARLGQRDRHCVRWICHGTFEPRNYTVPPPARAEARLPEEVLPFPEDSGGNLVPHGLRREAQARGDFSGGEVRHRFLSDVRQDVRVTRMLRFVCHGATW